jgi:hypothetical protein
MKFAVAVLACLALAVPAASARPVEQYLDPATSCEQQWVAAYGAPAPRDCVEQMLASRGSGAPEGSEVGTSGAPSLPSADEGFDWGAAAIGAGAAGLIAFAGWSVLTVSRRHVRTARP